MGKRVTKAAESSVRRLYLLRLALAQIPLGEGRVLDMVLGCGLVELADGRRVLIDSGMAEEQGPDGGTMAGRKSVLEALAEIGVEPEAVSVVVLTHLDVDHVGHLEAFQRAELVMQRAAWEEAQAGGERYGAARRGLTQAGLRMRLVEGDMELEPGLDLLATPGHAAGHQSVLARLARTGAVLLAGDAVPLERMFTTERGPWVTDDDLPAARASTRRLMEVVRKEQALVIFGHDGAQWRQLRVAPEFYD